VTTRNAVALTFDDGPSESTPELLAILDRHSVRATFFQCGIHAERLPAVARAVSTAGHQIGNHTYSHPRLWLRSPAFIAAEVECAQRTLARVHGEPPKFFRPTYGVRWFGLREVQHRCGLLGVMWTALGLDWKRAGSSVARRLLAAARPGAIFCLHDGREAAIQPDIGATLEAVNALLPALAARGYRFETLSEILCPNN
jgi:peptidoglycan/xylan/chitin deacetylase (PgdA/CDA1 family)